MKRGIWGIIGLSLLAACSEAPSTADCEALLGHVVELELAPPATTAPATTAPASERKAQQQKLIEQVGKDFLATCEKELRASQVACALRAKSGTDLASCDET